MTAIAYLVSEYPAVSHTFIAREIEVLRQRGMQVKTISVNSPRHPKALGEDGRREAEQTLVLKRQSPLALAWAWCQVICRHPLGFGRMAALAFTLCFKGPRHPVKALGYLLEAVFLIPWLKRHGIHHIHEHFANPTALVAMMLQRFGGFSYSLSIHGPDIFYNVDSAYLREKIRHAQFVRCISDYCRSQVLKLLGPGSRDHIHIVRCGIDPQRYQPVPEAANAKPRILCVGRLCRAKGQEILLEACSGLKRQGIPFDLVLVGDGETRQPLMHATEKLDLNAEVTFAGAMSQEEVLRQYQLADVFVLPTFAEGLPVVLMEAMAMELPTITTPVNGIPELVQNGENGLLVPPANAEQLTNAIRDLIADETGRQSMARRARTRVLESYDQTCNNNVLGDLFLQYGALS